MSHQIDETTGRAAIAFVGETPWHGLGQQLTQGASIEEWTREAGLAFEVKRAPVLFRDDAGFPCAFDGRDVLYRGDTKGRLGIVGSDYKVVQPARLMAFMAALMKHNGFEMEVAGALDGGKRVWALARVAQAARECVIGHDEVRPYILAATSYDGSMSTIAKFTEIRVVCNNTITAAVGAYNAETGMRSGGEKDKTDGPVVQCVRIPHSQDFDPESARMDLGIALTAHEEFMIRARLLAHTAVDEKFVVAFLRELLPKPRATKREGEQPAQEARELKVEDTRTFQRLLATWKGDVPSATLPEAQGTAWALLNAVTWDVDHVRGRDGSRLGSAWFGTGEGLKTKALELLTAVARGERELEQA